MDALRTPAWSVLRRFDKPFLFCWSDSDHVTGGGERVFLREVPGRQGQQHTTTEDGGHFLQEDIGPELAAVPNSFLGSTGDTG